MCQHNTNGRRKDYTKGTKQPQLTKECSGRQKLPSCAFPDGGQIDSSRESQSRLPNGVRLTLYGPVDGRHLVPELFTRWTTRLPDLRQDFHTFFIYVSFVSATLFSFQTQFL